jgi:NAD(P)-dependent dehydrogenase (short-subunit alcohol dehydrogenase family)
MKTAIVTGASGNLGPVWVETLEDMDYLVWDIGLPEIDITDKDAIKTFRDWTLVKYIPSVLVLNAAIDNPPGSEATFHGNLERIIAVNLIGACNVVKAFLPKMIDNGGGVIIGISSIQAHVGADWRNYQEGFEKPVGYNISKAGLEQYMRSLTVQYGRYGIRTCCIGFGAYDSGQLGPVFLGKYLKNVPLGRLVSRQSAKAALRFAVECPEFAGQTVMVEGGYLSL